MSRRAGTEGLRILVLNWQDRDNPQAGGAEIHLHETFGRLARRGHDVTLVASGFEGAEARATLDGIRVVRTGGRHTYPLAAPVHCRRHVPPESFDVVVEDLNKVPLFAPLWTRTPVVLLVHHLFGRSAFREASFPVAAATWLLERPVPAVFRHAPTVAVSESTADELGDRGMRRERIRVIPNGVDLAKYAPDPAVGRYDEPTLLYLGRLKRYKRVDLPLRALRWLRDRNVACRLLVAGQGDQRPELERKAAALGVDDHVAFLGWVSEERKVELFRKAWVHVLTSSKEGWGISNLEAAACATPTVASDRPGLRDSVRDGETGYLVPHGDVPALGARLRRLLDDDALRDEMGRAARRFAEGFSWDAAADAWEEVLAAAARS